MCTSRNKKSKNSTTFAPGNFGRYLQGRNGEEKKISIIKIELSALTSKACASKANRDDRQWHCDA